MNDFIIDGYWWLQIIFIALLSATFTLFFYHVIYSDIFKVLRDNYSPFKSNSSSDLDKFNHLLDNLLRANDNINKVNISIIHEHDMFKNEHRNILAAIYEVKEVSNYIKSQSINTAVQIDALSPNR